MFCKNCGFELEEEMAFCPECGAKTETEPVCEETVAEVVQEACEESVVVSEETDVEAVQEDVCEEESCVCAQVPADASFDEGTEVDPEAFSQQSAQGEDVALHDVSEGVLLPAHKSNKLLISLIAVVVMIALVVAGVFVVPKIFGGNYEEVAMNYGLAYAEADMLEASKYSISNFAETYSKMVDYSCEEYEMTREEFFELLSEQYGDKITSIEQLFAIMKEESVTYLKEEYGNYTLSAKVTGSEEMSAEDIAELKEYIKEDQGYDYPSMFEGVNPDDISEAYVVDVELTINGTESSDTEEQEITVVKYNGKWKAIGE